ncbi:hypothetical protein B6V88_09555 [Legionella micdadei]|nr:hypothetical protein B6V88_09555 [Legionella micdadei]
MLRRTFVVDSCDKNLPAAIREAVTNANLPSRTALKRRLNSYHLIAFSKPPIHALILLKMAYN